MIRAHHVATIQEYRRAEAEGVIVDVEWLTGGNPCPICADLFAGSPYKLDEIWARVAKSQRRLTEHDDPTQMGDFWTFVALDTDTRLVPAYKVGKRDLETTIAFLTDLRTRVTNRVLLSSDAMPAYVDAIDYVFGADVDYGQIVKSYEAEPIGPGRYSPPRVRKVQRRVKLGNPDERELSTTYVERSNLLMRMSIRRMTRLTDAFSRKLDNLKAAVSLHFAYYDFVRIHRSLRVTPAMAAGITRKVWSIQTLLNMTEDR